MTNSSSAPAESWTIWKYPIPLNKADGLHGDCFSINMPENAEILSVASQNNKPVLWAAVADERLPLETHHFYLCGTGQPLMKRPSNMKFIGTTLSYNGTLVLHVFEVLG